MKNLFKSMMLVAVAAMGFTACSKDTTANVAPEMEPGKVTMTITAENTRTYLDEANGKAQWNTTGEYITVYQLIDDAEKASLVDSSEGAITDGKASFAVSFDVAEGTNYKYSAIYPACNGVEAEGEESLTYVKLNTPIIQKPSTTSFDSNADLMIAKVIEKTEQPTELSMQFTRVIAIAKMSLTNMPTTDKLVNVTFEATGKILCGRSAFDVTTGAVVKYGYNSPSEKITLDYAENAIANNNAIYFTCLPVELTADDTFTVTATTENNVKYTRTVTLGETAKLNFTAGNMSTFSVNMASATSESLASLAGEYAIIAKANKALHVMGDAYSSNKYITQTEVAGTEIPEIYTTSDDQYIWIVEETSTNGQYYLKQKSTSKYVAYNSTDGNNPARLQDTGYALTITENSDGSVNITSVSTNTRNLRYNASSPRFAFYTSAQTSIYLVPVGEDTTPRITAETEVSLTAEECEGTVTITTKNVTGEVTATQGDVYDWFAAKIDKDGNLFYFAKANTATESRTATVTLSAEGAADVVITFTQAAQLPGTGEGTEASPYDVTRALAAIDAYGTINNAYVKGTITQIDQVSTEYGNATYYIDNDLQVYRGLYLGNVKFTAEDQIHEGDEVVVCGELKLYNTTYEFNTGSYIVSLNCVHEGGEEPDPTPDPGTGEDIAITLDFSTNIFNLSTSSGNDASSEITKTYNDYSYLLKATNSCYWFQSKALFLGKANSYVTFPAIEGYKLASVKASSNTGASEKTTFIICNTANTTAITGGTSSTITAGGSKTWTLTDTGANTSYRLYITNAYNAQLTKIELTYVAN